MKSERLFVRIADRLSQAISAGTYPVGGRLPAERDLASELGVSRPVVREAMIVLETRGLISVRSNGGTIVASRNAAPAQGLPKRDASPFEVTESRRLLEGEIAALAAPLISEAQLTELEDTLSVMDNLEIDWQAREAADRAFHLGLAKATGNAVLAAMVENLWDMRYNSPLCVYFFQQARNCGIEPPADQHRAIIKALRTGDPDQARESMRAHLTHVTQSLQVATEADSRERERLKLAEQAVAFVRRAQLNR